MLTLSCFSFDMSFDISCLLSICFLDFVFAFPTSCIIDKDFCTPLTEAEKHVQVCTARPHENGLWIHVLLESSVFPLNDWVILLPVCRRISMCLKHLQWGWKLNDKQKRQY